VFLDTITTEFSPSGLRNQGLHSIVSVNDATWVPLPAAPLSDRNAIAIQNNTGFEMKINYVDNVGYVGMSIPPSGERTYDIKDSIIIYGRMTSGAGAQSIDVEELS
jgi:hypothetical protein